MSSTDLQGLSGCKCGFSLEFRFQSRRYLSVVLVRDEFVGMIFKDEDVRSTDSSASRPRALSLPGAGRGCMAQRTNDVLPHLKAGALKLGVGRPQDFKPRGLPSRIR